MNLRKITRPHTVAKQSIMFTTLDTFIEKGSWMCCYFDIFVPLQEQCVRKFCRHRVPSICFVTILVWCQKKSPYQYGVPYRYGDAYARLVILRVWVLIHIYIYIMYKPMLNMI